MSSLKQEFLKKWIEGLQRCSSRKKNMSVLERKKAIKLSADVAMASARKGKTCWSRAVIADASKVEILKGTESHERRMILMNNNNKRKMISRRSKKILKSSSRRIRRASKYCATTSKNIAERLVRKRTQVLKSLIPGGESMKDEVSLIEETLDYIISLRAQVDVMRSLANVSELVNNHN